ncbi:thioredoxin family protein [Thermovibrio ammonificans]|uniref:Glutaredoxin 2 n=1 Tax=Thermovibrio ammonificans (strain DSM 15698 / JCM 12110 / HB-1) TaxID=648996 RepID=E8T5M5_THEA1|nr:thioredoxin family protein [Thermovibrio ammonificans]ADU96500.1 glutaredoxin 2 [Thermovibrio ammonificans HB-1]
MRLLFFSSARCSVCEPLKEKVKAAAEEFGVEFKELPLEQFPQEAAQRLIFSAPTVVAEEEGRELRRWSGVFSVESVREFLRRYKS